MHLLHFLHAAMCCVFFILLHTVKLKGKGAGVFLAHNHCYVAKNRCCCTVDMTLVSNAFSGCFSLLLLV